MITLIINWKNKLRFESSSAQSFWPPSTYLGGALVWWLMLQTPDRAVRVPPPPSSRHKHSNKESWSFLDFSRWFAVRIKMEDSYVGAWRWKSYISRKGMLRDVEFIPKPNTSVCDCFEFTLYFRRKDHILSAGIRVLLYFCTWQLFLLIVFQIHFYRENSFQYFPRDFCFLRSPWKQVLRTNVNNKLNSSCSSRLISYASHMLSETHKVYLRWIETSRPFA